jgi:ATP-dependent Clp protease ATP-binding subunit ClpB
MLSDTVTAGDISRVVSKTTGIPVENLIVSEKEKLLHMEDRLKHNVVGQDEAISLIS